MTLFDLETLMVGTEAFCADFKLMLSKGQAVIAREPLSRDPTINSDLGVHRRAEHGDFAFEGD